MPNKDPLYTGRIDLTGREGGGIYFTDPATGDVSTIVNEAGELVDTGSTFEDANLTGTATIEDVEVSGTAEFASTVTLTGGLLSANSGAVTETSLTVRDFLILDASSRSGAGAIPQTNPAVNLTTTGIDALTLADSAVDNQILTITMIVDGGDGTLTPATPLGYSTITFNSVGDSVVLRWIPTLGWAILSNFGCTVA